MHNIAIGLGVLMVVVLMYLGLRYYFKDDQPEAYETPIDDRDNYGFINLKTKVTPQYQVTLDELTKHMNNNFNAAVSKHKIDEKWKTVLNDPNLLEVKPKKVSKPKTKVKRKTTSKRKSTNRKK